MEKHRDVFHVRLGNDPPARVPPMAVELLDDAELLRCQGARRLSPLQQQFVNEHVAMLLRTGVAKRSSSQVACSVVLVVKKADGSWRFCVDLRRVNSAMEKGLWPLPHLELPHIEKKDTAVVCAVTIEVRSRAQ